MMECTVQFSSKSDAAVLDNRAHLLTIPQHQHTHAISDTGMWMLGVGKKYGVG